LATEYYWETLAIAKSPVIVLLDGTRGRTGSGKLPDAEIFQCIAAGYRTCSSRIAAFPIFHVDSAAVSLAEECVQYADAYCDLVANRIAQGDELNSQAIVATARTVMNVWGGTDAPAAPIGELLANLQHASRDNSTAFVGLEREEQMVYAKEMHARTILTQKYGHEFKSSNEVQAQYIK
jgi:hypothetical protein